MERMKRSFTFSGRSKRRNRDDEDKDKKGGKKNKSPPPHNVENGVENSEAVKSPPKSDKEALQIAQKELDGLRKQFEDAEERYREAHSVKRNLLKDNDGLEKKLEQLTGEHSGTLKELESLREDVKRLQSDASQLDCDKEDLQENFHRKSHALERELRDARATSHQYRDVRDKLEKELKDIKTNVLPHNVDKKVTMIKLHAVFKNVSEEFVSKSLKLASADIQGFAETFISEWTGDREVAEPKDVVVYFLGLDSQPDWPALKEDFHRVSTLGKLSVLVPLSSLESSISLSPDSLLSLNPISLSSIKADLVGGSLSREQAVKIADACKVAHLNALLPQLLLA